MEGEKQENGWFSLSLSLPYTRTGFHYLIRDAALLHEYSCAELTVGRILHIGHHEQQQGWWGFSSVVKDDSGTFPFSF